VKCVCVCVCVCVYIYIYMLLTKKRGHYYLFIKHCRRRYVCLGASQQLQRRPTFLCQEHFIHRRIPHTVVCTGWPISFRITQGNSFTRQSTDIKTNKQTYVIFPANAWIELYFGLVGIWRLCIVWKDLFRKIAQRLGNWISFQPRLN
jgi:hypothetical protein